MPSPDTLEREGCPRWNPPVRSCRQGRGDAVTVYTLAAATASEVNTREERAHSFLG